MRGNKFINFIFFGGTIAGNFLVGILLIVIGSFSLSYAGELEDKALTKKILVRERLDVTTRLQPSITEFDREISKFETRPSLLSNESLAAILHPVGTVLLVTGILLFLSGIFRGSAYLIGLPFKNLREEIKNDRKERNELIATCDKNENKTQLAWFKAQETLDKYYDLNVEQMNHVFIISVLVMFAGFLLVIIPIFAPNVVASNKLEPIESSETQIENLDSSAEREEFSMRKFSIIAGLTTEFISTILFFVYRSTADRAAQYVKSLEKTNSIGIAMQIINSKHLKNLGEQDLMALEKILKLADSGQLEMAMIGEEGKENSGS